MGAIVKVTGLAALALLGACVRFAPDSQGASDNPMTATSANDLAAAGADLAPAMVGDLAPADLTVVPDLGACGAPNGAFPTCKALFDACHAPSGTYLLDLDGAGGSPAFPAWCDMSTAGGGWTLVALERSGETGNLKYLGVDSGNDADIANGTASGIVGKRFAGRWTEMWIQWGQDFARFRFKPAVDVFDNGLHLHLPLAAFDSSDPLLVWWNMQAAGFVFCVASGSPDVRPGDSSWAIKPQSDFNTQCGCNGALWQGQGAFYGGVPTPTTCGNYGGGFAGTRNNGVPKGGIVPGYDTRIYVR